MKYIKFTCSNGYCGCDEDFYEMVEDDDDINSIAREILENEYSFYEPDGRFLPGAADMFDDDYEDYLEDYDAYMENLSVNWEEMSKDEYERNV
jgi:hypothetical protein